MHVGVWWWDLGDLKSGTIEFCFLMYDSLLGRLSCRFDPQVKGKKKCWPRIVFLT